MKQILTIMSAVLFSFVLYAQHIDKIGTGKKTTDKQNTNKHSSATHSGQAGYSTGIGLRGGFEGGLTIKHFIKETRAVEGILSTDWGYGGFRFTGLYEIHKPFPDAQGLDWFYGLGAHVGSYNGHYYGYYGYSGNGYYDHDGNWHPTGYKSHYTTFGLDLILGLEYQFNEIPFTVGLDIKPYFDFVGRGDHFADGALTLRYIIK